MKFTRTELGRGAITVRTPDSYGGAGGLTTPGATAHTPEYEQAARELARAVIPGPDYPSDPVERALRIWTDIESAREMARAMFIENAAEDALDIEVALRAGRAPPAEEPMRSEDERMEAAKAAWEAHHRG